MIATRFGNEADDYSRTNKSDVYVGGNDSCEHSLTKKDLSLNSIFPRFTGSAHVEIFSIISNSVFLSRLSPSEVNWV